MTNVINIFNNKSRYTYQFIKEAKEILYKHNFKVSEEYNKDAILNLVIGGDGTFLRAVHRSNFSQIPVIGVNTGHLGFYQDISPDEFENFLFLFENKKFEINNLNLVESKFAKKSFQCLNEMVIRSRKNEIIRMKVFIDGNFLEDFAGDGIIISTPHGSTAYNLSAGGAVMHQSLGGFQLTPIAPLKNATYNSLTSSLVCPQNSKINIVISKRDRKKAVLILDGREYFPKDFKFSISISNTYIKKIILDKNRYWNNIKDKIL
ncbi:MAG: NAD(+)/NADH kinase [Peptoniphilaceae bacterium]|nr:NAD(+)/NADH kinase [Peptoniphilaceae bacterium]